MQSISPLTQIKMHGGLIGAGWHDVNVIVRVKISLLPPLTERVMSPNTSVVPNPR